MKYKTLFNEMQKYDISLDMAAQVINRHKKTLIRKLEGKSEFYIDEVIKLEKCLKEKGSTLDVDDLFQEVRCEGKTV